jgi:hypothetical protein
MCDKYEISMWRNVEGKDASADKELQFTGVK